MFAADKIFHEEKKRRFRIRCLDFLHTKEKNNIQQKSHIWKI